jgi:hypothetical protein
MVAIRGLVVVAVCSVLCASAAVRADDKKPMELKKKLTLLTVSAAIDTDEFVDAVKKRYELLVIARVPLFGGVLLFWGTDEDLFGIIKLTAL